MKILVLMADFNFCKVSWRTNNDKDFRAFGQPSWRPCRRNSSLLGFQWGVRFQMSLASDVFVCMACSYPSSRVELLWCHIRTCGRESFILCSIDSQSGPYSMLVMWWWCFATDFFYETCSVILDHVEQWLIGNQRFVQEKVHIINSRCNKNIALFDGCVFG